MAGRLFRGSSTAVRNDRHGVALRELATATRWDTDPTATAAIARSIYTHLPGVGPRGVA